MNLELLKEYFTFLANIERKLQNAREKIQTQKYNSYSFFKLISVKSAPEIDEGLLKNFIQSFTYDFTITNPDQINQKANYQIHPLKEFQDSKELLDIGVQLFLKKWSKQGKMNFSDFSLFFKQTEEMPQKAREMDYPIKKRFFEMIEIQIQSLLNADSYRKAVALEYKNIADLFEMLTSDNILTMESINNLYLMNGERKDEEFLERIGKRFVFPCSYDNFKAIFSGAIDRNKYKKQTKIFYSSLSRKAKLHSRRDDQDDEELLDNRYMTPGVKKTVVGGMSSTRMTKGQRLNSLRQAAVEVSRFDAECPETSERKNQIILGEILNEQEKLNELKRQLLFQQDFDLELIYERRGKQFQQILNSSYGSCNFTSFVRFIIPQDYEHRSLAFIKYQKHHQVSEETHQMIDHLIESYYLKEENIANWWTHLDKEIVFRSYCYPRQKYITQQQFHNYFTQRENNILFDRMDPNRTGQISFDNFK